MSPNFIQKQLSQAYVRAVVYNAGFSLSSPEEDYYGIDGTIDDPTRRGVNRIDFQLKSTTNYEIRDGAIVYDLRVEDYNRLIRDDDVPRVLILYLMPDDRDEWLAQGPEQLCLRECAFWHSLMGEPRSPNVSHKRVFVPQGNVFSRDGLQDMFRRLI